MVRILGTSFFGNFAVSMDTESAGSKVHDLFRSNTNVYLELICIEKSSAALH